MHPATRFAPLAFSLLVLSMGGCNGGSSYRAGAVAERQGNASQAYEEYLRAGARHRGGAVAQAIERIAPLAASEAESSALAAMDDGRYQDAWRMLMRTLEILPSHPNAPQLIRRLEREHPNEIAAAKADYMRRGFAALAMTTPPHTALAQADPEISRTTPPSPRARSERSAARKPPVTARPVEPPPIEAAPPPSAPGPASRVESPSNEVIDVRREYLLVHTLSLRDRRYPRVTKTIDGITIRLKDTDDDPDVDLDLYDGKRRIQKIRELEMGRSQTFRGRSGDLYRLTILHIHHKTHTVRIGIRPA